MLWSFYHKISIFFQSHKKNALLGGKLVINVDDISVFLDINFTIPSTIDFLLGQLLLIVIFFRQFGIKFVFLFFKKN